MSTPKKYQHTSVMLEQALKGLAIERDGVYIDATYGRGGHSRAILSSLGGNGRLIAFDKDPDAKADANILQTSDPRLTFCFGSYATINETINELGLTGRISGVLFDLGVSSPQLEDSTRGFSFRLDGPLDMRMNNTKGLTASNWLNTAAEKEIAATIFKFGEEKEARKIAKAICKLRQEQPLISTKQLADLVASCCYRPNKHSKIHPATKTFQAIRIKINNELEELELALPQAVEVLKPEGRLVVITFHSLEDRIVKHFIRAESASLLPHYLPVKESQRPKGRLEKLSKAITATEEEIANNPRARSSKCRIAKRT